jgi:putative tryptophan/tyrosine transport system substrate-binding protein
MRRTGLAVVLTLSFLLAAMVAEPQPTSRVWRIGFLGDGPRAERASISLDPFRDGLRELGYIENQNVLLEERWSGGRSERLQGLAVELAGLKVDVIVTHGVRAIKLVSGWRFCGQSFPAFRASQSCGIRQIQGL